MKNFSLDRPETINLNRSALIFSQIESILMPLGYHFCVYSNSSEFKGKHETDNNSAAEFDTKFVKISILPNSLQNLIPLKGFYRTSLRVRQYL